MLGLEPQRLTTGLPLYTGDGGVLEVSIIEYEISAAGSVLGVVVRGP